MAILGPASSGLRIAGVLLITSAIGVSALAYATFVSEQRAYFTGRNFRLLSTLARQINSTVGTETRVIANLPVAIAEEGLRAESSVSDLIGLSEGWARVRRSRYPASDIQFVQPPPRDPAVEYAFEAGPDFRLRVHARSRGDPGDPPVIARLRLEHVLAPLFIAKTGQAFDTVVLARQEGDVLYAVGRRAHDLQSSGLAGLPRHAPKGAQPRPFAELVRTTTVEDVTIAGVAYKLFLQPCCVPTAPGETPLVLAGLVESNVLRSQSWAISTTLVKLALMAIIMALIARPFLKLALIGDRQQVRVWDLCHLGASSVAGLGIITIAVLDVFAYRQLNRDTDAQLKRLAASLDENVREEIRDAYRQLTCLERHTKGNSERMERSILASSLSCPDTATWAYPFFENYSLIDRNGRQKVRLTTAGSPPSVIDVSERSYFQIAKSGRGWQDDKMCPAPGRCSFESIWSWTTAEPLAVLAKTTGRRDLPVATISMPMRSLIRPVLPPGFEFAVIDRSGKVLFHSDRQRNVHEDFFEETDDNRRLRAQIAAHSAEPVGIRYWGAAYRAYVKPMALPDAYVVAMAQKHRAWAINREWLVVALIFLFGYLVLWLVVALITLRRDSSWIWPDSARRASYQRVIGLCLALIAVAAAAVWHYDMNGLIFGGLVLPLAGWIGASIILKRRPAVRVVRSNQPAGLYTVAAVLLLIVIGVLPGALFFLASFHLHVQSYVKNSQLSIARALSERTGRLSEEYSDERGGGKQKQAWTRIDPVVDRDLYVTFLYDTCIQDHGATGKVTASSCLAVERTADTRKGTAKESPGGENDMILTFLEDYLPYYSEASVEWRELLHKSADDHSWESEPRADGRLTLKVDRRGTGRIALTSGIPTLSGSVGFLPNAANAPAAWLWDGAGLFLVLGAALGLIAITWGIVHVFKRHIFLVGVTEPLWASVKLAVNAGDNIFVLGDQSTKTGQIKGTVALKLGPIARNKSSIGAAWRKALIELDRRNRGGGAVLVDDFDEDLDDISIMDAKLALLEELVADPSRTVVLVSQLSPTGLSDTLRQSVRDASPVEGRRHKRYRHPALEPPREPRGEPPHERWRRVLKLFMVVEWREIESHLDGAQATVAIQGPAAADASQPPRGTPVDRKVGWLRHPASAFEAWRRGRVRTLLDAEGGSHAYVKRVCGELRESEAVREGRLTYEQAFDEILERSAQYYRSIWTSCSEDEKVVLGHIAEHGLANASVRTVVRRLLGRGLLVKDPALRPMNETFRRFVLLRECRSQVVALEAAAGPSAWDRVRVPLAVGVAGAAVFLFATQKELYNEILAVTTAAAVSVPTLMRAVSMLAGRRMDESGRA